MPETVSLEQLLGRGEVVVKILSIGTLPSPAMMVLRGHGHICPATYYTYGIWIMEYGISIFTGFACV